jgi:enterochelin esterase family protein
MRIPSACALALALFGAIDSLAQDMPLSQVLIDGEGWQVISNGHAFTDGCAADAYGNFYFSDVAQGDSIQRISIDGTISTFVQDAPKISAMQFGPDGRLYACQVGKFGRIVAFERDGSATVIAENVKPNDLVVTHQGDIYFTETPKQQVTHIPLGGTPKSAATGIAKPNGIALTPGQGTLVVSDYGGRHGWVWRIESDGTLAHQQPYITLRTPSLKEPSKGDGTTTDSAGRFYITSAVGLQMFDPTGRMGGVIDSPQPSKPLVSVAFAGPDLSYLYVANGDKIYRRKTKTRGILYFQKRNQPRTR